MFLHGIGSSADEWKEVIKILPGSVHIIAIDLLGFGNSPRPEWARYNAKEQARAVITTLFRAGIRRRLIVVGHSMGALVAVEVAKRYPLLVRSLILCSPPFYNSSGPRRLPNADKILQQIYSQVERRQTSFLKISEFALKHKLVNPAFSLTEETLPAYIQTLKGTIISQSAYQDVKTVKRPITIIYGTLDPFVVDRRLKSVARSNPHITLVRILAGHEIMGRFARTIAKIVKQHIDHHY